MLEARQEMSKAEKSGKSQVTQGSDVKQRHLNFPCSVGATEGFKCGGGLFKCALQKDASGSRQQARLEGASWSTTREKNELGYCDQCQM